MHIFYQKSWKEETIWVDLKDNIKMNHKEILCDNMGRIQASVNL
jgi:hypothetical protein